MMKTAYSRPGMVEDIDISNERFGLQVGQECSDLLD